MVAEDTKTAPGGSDLRLVRPEQNGLGLGRIHHDGDDDIRIMRSRCRTLRAAPACGSKARSGGFSPTS